MSGEIDRMILEAMLDRPRDRLSYVSNEDDQRKRSEGFNRRVKQLLVDIFNDPAPYLRLSYLTGRSDAYWRAELSRGGGIRKAAAQLLMSALLAHCAGIRDHVSDVEKSIAALNGMIDDPACFKRRRKSSASRQKPSGLR